MRHREHGSRPPPAACRVGKFALERCLVGHGAIANFACHAPEIARLCPLRTSCRSGEVRTAPGMVEWPRLGAKIEFENAGNHDHGVGPIAVFESRIPERFGAADEQPAAEALLILHNPVALAVSANQEKNRWRGGSTRGRFGLSHDTAPFSTFGDLRLICISA